MKTLAQEILGLTGATAYEELSDSEIKRQAQTLVDYLKKSSGGVPEQAKMGAKWLDSKDFAPEDRDAILAGYDKLATDGMPSAQDIDTFTEGAAKDADDKEDAELVKLMIGQKKMLQAVRDASSICMQKAIDYNSFLTKNKIEALMSDDAIKLADSIHKNLDKVKEIV